MRTNAAQEKKMIAQAQDRLSKLEGEVRSSGAAQNDSSIASESLQRAAKPWFKFCERPSLYTDFSKEENRIPLSLVR